MSEQQTVTVQKGRLGQDAVLFAIAILAPGVILRNIEPAKVADWVKRTATGVAHRALADHIGPSTMYSFTQPEEIHSFLTERKLMRDWHLRTFLARSVVTDGDKYVYVSITEAVESDEALVADEFYEAPGRHISLCFVGVPRVFNCPDYGQLTPPPRITNLICHRTDKERLRFILHLDTASALKANVPDTIVLEFTERLTVEEYLVAPGAGCEL